MWVISRAGLHTRRHARIQRQQLEKHILSDPFAEKRLSEITRADVLDLGSRLLKKNAPATVNKALGLVKVIFREALYREEIPRDPTAGVGRIKYRREERGTFTVEELRALFSKQGYGPWGEILVLRWQHVDFDRHFLTVSEAWKGGGEIGPPKWDHARLVPLSPITYNFFRFF